MTMVHAASFIIAKSEVYLHHKTMREVHVHDLGPCCQSHYCQAWGVPATTQQINYIIQITTYFIL
jgi:hypothetical protein